MQDATIAIGAHSQARGRLIERKGILAKIEVNGRQLTGKIIESTLPKTQLHLAASQPRVPVTLAV